MRQFSENMGSIFSYNMNPGAKNIVQHKEWIKVHKDKSTKDTSTHYYASMR